ncbi:hypothetical protein BC940DRAFT_335203 [Gongronella butleri]|nr:hypothetical protein BC940DRAFT_335203 [Gongronella butleri]
MFPLVSHNGAQPSIRAIRRRKARQMPRHNARSISNDLCTGMKSVGSTRQMALNLL